MVIFTAIIFTIGLLLGGTQGYKIGQQECHDEMTQQQCNSCAKDK